MAERNRQMKLSKLHKEAATTKMIAKLDELAAKRNVWQAEHDRTNVGLYNLQANCLELYYEIKGTTAEKEILAGIKTVLTARGVKVMQSTPVLTMLVRYVFNAERRRAHSYARALRVAVNEKVTATDFAGWIAKFGGVEEVANTKGATEETLKKRAKLESKIEEVKELLVQQLITPLATAPKTALVNVADTGEYTLLIGKTLASGETQVLSVVPDSTSAMIDAAIRKIAEALINGVDSINKEIAVGAVVDALKVATNDAVLLDMAA